MTLVSWSGAAYGDKSTMEKRRLGYVIGLMSSATRVPCHMIQRTSTFTRKLVKRSLGGEVYAYSEMVDRISVLREFRAHFLDLFPDMLGLEACESLFTRVKNGEITTDKFTVRHFLAARQAMGRPWGPTPPGRGTRGKGS